MSAVGTKGWNGIMAAYEQHLPVPADRADWVTLQEGNTPLIEVPRLARAIGLTGQLFVKLESQNPTGSFKDRGMTLAVSHAKAAGSRWLVCASTGNTSASAAAYAARAGLGCLVLIPGGKVALGKLSQAARHGAKILQVRGNFDQAFDLVKAIVDTHALTLVNSINPFRLEGQKTAAFEVVDVLGRAPDVHALPVGNAGNISAYWRGYRAYHQQGRFQDLPRMMGYQAEGAAPLVYGGPIKNPETIATAIRIGNPASGEEALRAARESSGGIAAVSDAEILEAYDRLAQLEGVFCEPSSAASVAGITKSLLGGQISPTSTVVCTLTGHGLKDPDTALSRPFDRQEIDPTLPALVKIVEALA